MAGSVVDIIVGVVNWPVSINAAPLYGQRYASNHTVPFWLLVASFAIIYSILWLASNNVPIFKKKEGLNTRGPRAMFTLAVAFIALFGTPLAIWIMWLIYTFTLLSVLAILILGAYILWTLTREQWAANAAKNAASTKVLADASTANAASERQNAQTKEYKAKTKEAARKGLRYQLREIRKLQRDMKQIVTHLYNIKHRRVYPVHNNAVSKVINDISKIRQDLGNILTYATNNDRILSTMNTSSYTENNAGNLTALNPATVPPNPTNHTASIRAGLETQTNDLGHTISAISETLQSRGVPDVETNNKLINWAEVAINIAHRMERDCVLEEQMIEKI
ncbi:MAG: hypothetical protein ACP5N2_04210 [Candidatus Nanoarchaeia archaeon]